VRNADMNSFAFVALRNWRADVSEAEKTAGQKCIALRFTLTRRLGHLSHK